MASLKEVKGRIASVNSTLKITSAMKMVASAKLHRAQGAIENMLPYERKLNGILSGFLSAEGSVSSPFAEKREVQRVAIVAVSSNSSLCGAFNANVAKKLHETIASYGKLKRENILIFPIGKKIAEATRKEGFEPQGDYQKMAEKPTYKETSDLAARLMKMFANHEIDRVELIYNHFKSTAVQVLTREEYLPIDTEQQKGKGLSADYIVEPDRADPAGAGAENFHRVAGFERRRACRPDDRYANGDGQCDRTDPGTYDPVQQNTPAVDYERTARYDGKRNRQ